jgi:hypothetical protein
MPITAKTRLGMQAIRPNPMPAIAAPREAISSAPDTIPIVEATPTRTPTNNANKDSPPNIASGCFMARGVFTSTSGRGDLFKRLQTIEQILLRVKLHVPVVWRGIQIILKTNSGAWRFRADVKFHITLYLAVKGALDVAV